MDANGCIHSLPLFRRENVHGSTAGNEKIQEEMREAEEEIEDDHAVHDRLPNSIVHEHEIPLEEIEGGGRVAD